MSQTQPPTEGRPIEERLAELVVPVLTAFPPEQRPAVIALAERIAGERYRGWAAQIADPEARRELLACADREDEVASRAEALVPGADDVQAAVREAHPDLAERYAALFEDHPLAEQFALQARAERVGASTWRSIAEGSDAEASTLFGELARLEEASAAVLEALVGKGVA